MWAALSEPWQACVAQAWEAGCAGTVPIGAAVAGPGGEVLVVGRNRIYGPRSGSADYISGVRLAHAELNALIALEGIPVDQRTCTLYTTMEPCPLCAGALAMANVRRVCYASPDPWAGSTNLYEATRYMRGKKMSVEGPSNDLLRDLLIAVQVEFFCREDRQRGRNGDHPVTAALAPLHPRAVRLGGDLDQDGRLQALREAGCPAQEAFERLEGWFQEIR